MSPTWVDAAKGIVMARKRTTRIDGPAPIEAVRHKDKRKNIPTEELPEDRALVPAGSIEGFDE